MFDAPHLAGWREIMQTLRPKIERALRLGDYDVYDFDSLILAVERARLKLFYRSDAVLFCEMNLHPQVKVLTIVLVAGRMKSVVALAECAEAWGKAMNCTKVQASGRCGWIKAATRRGWHKSRWITMWKEL